jgi:phospholipase C
MKQYVAAAADPSSSLYTKGIAPTPLGQFEYDAMNDQQPTVSWLFPPSADDEHPARRASSSVRPQRLA